MKSYYRIGGLDIEVASDAGIGAFGFLDNIAPFRVEQAETDPIRLRHLVSSPMPGLPDDARLLDQRPPLRVWQRGASWLYTRSPMADVDGPPVLFAEYNDGHTSATILHRSAEDVRSQLHNSLSLLPSDQLTLAHVLADRSGCYFHSAGAILDGRAFVFIGHSGAGKSTLVRMIREQGAEILCDDRVIVRRVAGGIRAFGTWSHGELPYVSPASAPLAAIFFLEQAEENRAIPLEDRREIARRLPFFVIRPVVTSAWWEKTLAFLADLARETPAYRLRFDRSGGVIDAIRRV